MNKRLLAVDPGANGGFCWLPLASESDIPLTQPMPATEGDVVALLRTIKLHGIETLILEQVGGYAGGDGAPGSRMFNFGENFGIIKGAALAFGYRIETITPQKWQKYFGFGKKLKRIVQTGKRAGKLTVDNTEWKNRLRSKALMLYPNIDLTLATADALLLFEYGQRTL